VDDSNIQLIGFCKGDNKSISHFYDCYKHELFLVAYNYLRDSDDAKDAVSNCFEKILSTSHEYRTKKFIDEGVSLKALLLVMIKNHCLDTIKQQKNRQSIVSRVIHMFPVSSKNKASTFITEESFNKLCDCLPEKEQRILKMHIDGYSHEEIATAENSSEKTISNNLSMARNNVRDLWEQFMV